MSRTYRRKGKTLTIAERNHWLEPRVSYRSGLETYEIRKEKLDRYIRYMYTDSYWDSKTYIAKNLTSHKSRQEERREISKFHKDHEYEPSFTKRNKLINWWFYD